MPVASDAERPLPNAWRDVPGAPKGNKNALKHGHYTAKAIAMRREIAKVLRDAKGSCEEVIESERALVGSWKKVKYTARAARCLPHFQHARAAHSASDLLHALIRRTFGADT